MLTSQPLRAESVLLYLLLTKHWDVRSTSVSRNDISNCIQVYLWENERLQVRERERERDEETASLLPLTARVELTCRTACPVPVLVVLKWNTEPRALLEPSCCYNLLLLLVRKQLFLFSFPIKLKISVSSSRSVCTKLRFSRHVFHQWHKNRGRWFP